MDTSPIKPLDGVVGGTEATPPLELVDGIPAPLGSVLGETTGSFAGTFTSFGFDMLMFFPFRIADGPQEQRAVRFESHPSMPGLPGVRWIRFAVRSVVRLVGGFRHGLLFRALAETF